jgi:peptidoglycan/xylan/chitin deacetylase (PgdA/CDA1 family)
VYGPNAPSIRATDNDDPAWKWPESTWRTVVEKVRAGRSLKPAVWPDGARVAVALSFDSDHESTTLRFADGSPGRLSQGQYGARVAIPRIRKLLRRHSIPASFFVPAVVAQLHPDEQRMLIDDGHEIGIHGWIHEFNGTLEYADERDLQLRAADTLEAICAKRPVGIRTPSWDFSPNTLAITREMGLLYDSSLMADDEPYELLEDGEATGVVELPVEWIKDDAVYFNMDRMSGLRPHTPPSAVLEIFKAEFDGAYDESGLFLLTMHPHIIGHRSRISLLEALIDYISGHDGVWFATHEAVADYCRTNAGLGTTRDTDE